MWLNIYALRVPAYLCLKYKCTEAQGKDSTEIGDGFAGSSRELRQQLLHCHSPARVQHSDSTSATTPQPLSPGSCPVAGGAAVLEQGGGKEGSVAGTP